MNIAVYSHPDLSTPIAGEYRPHERFASLDIGDELAILCRDREVMARIAAAAAKAVAEWDEDVARRIAISEARGVSTWDKGNEEVV